MRILITLVLAASAAFAATRFVGTIPPPPCLGDYDCDCEFICQGGRPGGGDPNACGYEAPIYGICVPNCTPSGCIR